MSRPLPLTKREVTAICKGADAAGYAPVLQVGKVLIHLVPKTHILPAQAGSLIDMSDDPEVDAAFAELDARYGND
jgi:hypothetical protein